jgi:hypothetical protein
MHTTAAGKSPGDRTYELREFSNITDMLQHEKVSRASVSARRGCPRFECMVRSHKCRIITDRSKVKITASWLKRRARPNWAGKRKNGISRDALEMEHGLAATRAFFCDSVRRAAGRATAAVECAEDIANPLQRMGGLMDRGRRARLVAGVPRSSGRRSIAPLSLVC